MSEWFDGRVKTGGFFSSVKVMYEVKYIGPTHDGEIRSITQIREKDGVTTSKLEYSKSPQKAKISMFSVYDWSTPNYAAGMMKLLIKRLKREKVPMVEIEIYDTDNTTHNQLTLFKKFGFGIEAGGNITGYNKYHLMKKI